MQITVEAPAKLNLTLDVVGRRQDGYHLLESIMQTVDRFDTVTLRPIPDGIRLDTGRDDLGTTEKNTAFRAAKLFFEQTATPGGVAITLQKRIPTQAGMGGGSADAAAVLIGLDALFGTGLSAERLCRMGEMIGADVPFCLRGGTALVTGIGETYQSLPSLPHCAIAVAQPTDTVSTAAAYAALDGTALLRHPPTEVAVDAVRRGDLTGLCRAVGNVFEQVPVPAGVIAVRERMQTFSPLCVQMTGSGSAVFAVFDREETAQACVRSLATVFPVSFVCHPCGCRMEKITVD